MSKGASSKKKSIAQGILFVFVLYLAWLFFDIQKLYLGVIDLISPPPPKFLYAIIDVDNSGEQLIRDHQSIRTGLNSKIQVLRIEVTGVPERKVYLYSPRFNAEDLFTGTTLLRAVGEDIFKNPNVEVIVKVVDKPLGSFSINLSFTYADLIEELSKRNNRNSKIHLIKLALPIIDDKKRALEELGELFEEAEDWDQVIDVYKKLDRMDPKPFYKEKYANAYLKSNRLSLAYAVYNKLLLEEPDNKNILKILFYLAEKMNKLKEAVSFGNKLKELGYTDVNFLTHLAYLNYKTGNIDEAISIYREIAENNPPESIDPVIYYNLAELYQKKGLTDKAMACLEKLKELRPNDNKIHLILGDYYIEKGKFKLAEKELLALLKKEPFNRDILVRLSILYQKTHNIKKLKEVYRQLLVIDPNDKEVCFNLGVLSLETKDLAEAIVFFKKVLAIDEKDIEARKQLFHIYLKLNQKREAYKEAINIFRLKPATEEIYDFFFQYLGDIKKWKQLSKFMKKAVKIYPKNDRLRFYMAICLYKRKLFSKAQKEIEKAIKLSPNKVDYYLLLARIFEEKGNIDEAIRVYKIVLDKAPENNEAKNAYLRLVMERLKRKAKP